MNLLFDLIEEELVVRDGMIEIPDRPGLGITIDDDSELSPREPIQSVPYALVANNAVGDITPRSISVNNILIVDETGTWRAPRRDFRDRQVPPGPTGPAGAPGNRV
ncbi:MAG: hypothetical protein HC825_10030, partial [Oscillatoriales cyanobacterium RM1_1_9]|nr:hypothetical protein [Oscillatoriales cyanobacterium RM1_1_9]